jgi:hypothetical protein
MLVRRAGALAAAAVALFIAVAGSPASAGPEPVVPETPAARADLVGGPAALPSAVANAEIAANPIRCESDGLTGKRVSVLYVHETGGVDRYNLFAQSIRAYIAAVDDAYNDSAAKTGGSRHVRWVTEATSTGCRLLVSNVTVAAGTMAKGFAGVRAAVLAKGYNRTDRKYFMFDEDTSTCGVADGGDDDTPGTGNKYNTGPFFGEAGPDCWGSNAAAHEIAHLLGAVQDSAPHSDKAGHCTQEWDLVCYGDGITSFACDEKDNDRLLDCGNDDYFNTKPATGSYLATHWNVANSQFLIASSTPDNDDGHLRGGGAYVLKNAATGLAMEPANGSTGALTELTQRAVSGAPSQTWILNYDTGWQFVNLASQLCMDDSFSETAPGTTTLQYFCNQQLGMQWALQPVGTGSSAGNYALINYNSGLAVTSEGAGQPQQQQPYTGDAAQQWTLVPVAATVPAAGSTYTFSSRFNKSLTSTSTDLTMGAIASGTAQQFTLRAASVAGRFSIVSVSTGLCLKPTGGSATAGVHIGLSTCDDTAIEQWVPHKYSDARYGFVNASDGLALTSADGTAVTQEQYKGGEGSGGGEHVDRVWGLVKVG